MGSRASGVGSDFVIDDGTRKNTGDGGWCHAVGPTTCKAGFVVQKVGEKHADQVVWMCCFFVLGNAQETRIWVG